MQFFKHMSNMRHDPRVKRLMRQYKANGYAVYVLILESIAEGISTDSPLPVLEENVQDLSFDLGIPESLIEEIVMYCSNNGLLQIISETGTVYCVKIYKYLNTSQTRSNRLRQLIQAASGKDSEQLAFKDIENEIENTILLRYKQLPINNGVSETVCDKNDRKDKEVDRDKDKEVDKEKTIFPSFEEYKRPASKPVIDQVIDYWNTKNELPKTRMSTANLGERARALVEVIKLYTPEEIFKSVDNYHHIQTNPEKFDTFTSYGDVFGFIKSGIEKFCDDSKPFEVYKLKSPSSTTFQSEESHADMVRREIAEFKAQKEREAAQ